MTTSGVSEKNKTSPTNATELSSAVARQPVTSDSSNDVKKTSVEKKTADDGDDPFGALDWKDGIATLPGNTLQCFLWYSLFYFLFPPPFLPSFLSFFLSLFFHRSFFLFNSALLLLVFAVVQSFSQKRSLTSVYF